MSKSSLRKNATKTVVTNLVIGWDDVQTLGAGVSETGIAIYIVPRKGEASFQRMLWTVNLSQNPSASITVRYAIMNKNPQATFAGGNLSFAQQALMIVKQSWENLTSVGVVDTAQTNEVDMKEMVLSRQSNLQGDDEFAIVPAYHADTGIVAAQTGTLWVKETLTQENFRDDLDDWAGYTFEESAQ